MLGVPLSSLDYVTTAPAADGTSIGVLLLCEAALGKEASITQEDWRLTEPPEVYLAREPTRSREMMKPGEFTMDICGGVHRDAGGDRSWRVQLM